jgi:hypothetical protein
MGKIIPDKPRGTAFRLAGMPWPFDWAGLWAEACEAYDTADAKRAICAERDAAAAAYIRERIEAAFVPKEQWEDLKRTNTENSLFYADFERGTIADSDGDDGA